MSHRCEIGSLDGALRLGILADGAFEVHEDGRLIPILGAARLVARAEQERARLVCGQDPDPSPPFRHVPEWHVRRGVEA